MQINTEILAATSQRIDRQHGRNLRPMPVAMAGAALPAERLRRVTNYINENRAADDTAALERAMGTNDLLSLYYFWAGIRAARSVARIQIAPGPGDPGGYATGFMVGPNVLLTNWHVFSAPETASRSRAQFAFEADPDGNERAATSFSLLPGQFFHANKELDYAIVAIDPASRQGPDTLGSFGWLRLNPQLGKADYGQFLSIIQHPGGQTKQVAIRENKLFPFEDAENFLTYQSDTFRGSSGSPVFNDLWDVVALHHSGKPLLDAQGHYIGHDGQPILDHRPQEHEIKWIANEGARASRVVADILKAAPQGEHHAGFEAACGGTVKPERVALESAVVSRPAEGPAGAGGAGAGASYPLAVPDKPSVVVLLPLDVALRIERLDREKKDAAPVAATVASPAIATGKTAPDALVLEKLNFNLDYSDRRGYDESFLGRGRPAPMPTIDPAKRAEIAPTRSGGKILHYHHYSVMVHAKRRVPVLSACNTDYSRGQRVVGGRDNFGKDEWILDNRMDDKYQLPPGFYDRWKRLDYGHLVRRDDNCWGASETEIEYANSDTFHLTNATPQHEAFNRDMFAFNGLWGRLENLISSQAKRERALARLCIFAGPILRPRADLKLDDSEIGEVRVPMSFWKVVVAPTSRGGLSTFGFIVSQKQDLADDAPFEDFTPGDLDEEQVKLTKIEAQTIVRFDDALKSVDAMLTHPGGNESLPLTDANEIWTGRL